MSTRCKTFSRKESRLFKVGAYLMLGLFASALLAAVGFSFF